MNRYFADYVCDKSMIIIEIDGPDHINKKKYDAERDQNLRDYGYLVFRLKTYRRELWLSTCKTIQRKVLERIPTKEIKRREGKIKQIEPIDPYDPLNLMVDIGKKKKNKKRKRQRSHV